MRFKLIIALLSLSIGGTIYLLWRSESLLIFHWLDLININESLLELRSITSQKITLPNWVVYSLPNSLWLLSGLILFDLIWQEQNSVHKNFWIAIFCIIALGAEIAQLFNLIPGTFDLLDISLMLIAISIYMLLKTKFNLQGLT